MFKLCDDEFLASAPQRQNAAFEIPQPAHRVWAAPTADDTLGP
jgi:hypothetical protein